jgi:uncharacterized protein (DUF1330 family)
MSVECLVLAGSSRSKGLAISNWRPLLNSSTGRIKHTNGHYSPNLKDFTMAKAYWISAYRAVKDADKLAAYAKLAGPAIAAGGGRFLARGLPAKVYEFGLAERTVLIEFDSVEHAKAVHDSPDYQAALAALGDGAERDMRIVEGV